MNFVLLAPLGLAALAALVLPILIHLSRRAEQKITVFAALQWVSEHVRPRRRLRIEQPWLLLLRLLLLTLLALLLAQPALRLMSSPAKAVIAVAPGVDIAAARVQVGPQSGDWRWLAPGFPSINEPFPPRDVPMASLLRELDAQLPSDAHLTVVVPNELDGLDGERALLGHKVDWQVIANSASPASARAQVDSKAPIHVAIRYPATGDATARNASLRYLRAALAAWNVEIPERYQLDVNTDSTPLPANTQWLIWLGSTKDGNALPESITQWIEHGGIALSVDRKPTTDAPIWRDADGSILVTRSALGGGQHIRLSRPLRAESLPILLDAEFPQRLRELFRGPASAPTRAYADAATPGMREPGEMLSTSPIEPLDHWLVLAIALLAMIERVWATRRRTPA